MKKPKTIVAWAFPYRGNVATWVGPGSDKDRGYAVFKTRKQALTWSGGTPIRVTITVDKTPAHRSGR